MTSATAFRHPRSLRVIRTAAALALLMLATISGSFGETLPGFTMYPFFGEQVRTISFAPEVRIFIDAPADSSFDAADRVKLVFFALPNGNTIEQTFGKKLQSGDDWHFDIQHIGAQTRFIRNLVTDTAIVVVYLETAQLSWPSWRSKYANNSAIIKSIIDSVRNIFSAHPTDIVLASHSGGGSFMFGYIEGVTAIPNDIERIAFLDSDYNYTDAAHGGKLTAWLQTSSSHFLSVLAYNDSIALYNGQPIVSATGGTWYRTKQMVAKLKQSFLFSETFTADFQTYTALDRRVVVILKENPTRAILHTVQVELNGFIQTMLSGTSYEGEGYVYYGARAYSPYIQEEIPGPTSFGFVDVSPNSVRLAVKNDPSAESYLIELSADGIHFSPGISVNTMDGTLTGLTADSLYFARVKTVTASATSLPSEVLGFVPSDNSSVIVVNGFERATAGNTHDFIRQHGMALHRNGAAFTSATNDAVVQGLVRLGQFPEAVYILGEESTADETFSTAEQETMKTYLRGGGKLFVSGSEIAWDLDYKGSSTDKDFCRNYLKVQYAADNPGGAGGVGVYHTLQGTGDDLFGWMSLCAFDDGTHGTYNVRYPDVFTAVNGGATVIRYAGVSASDAAVCFEGTFPSGAKYGKVIVLGVPFETIYPDSMRDQVMETVLEFFSRPTAVSDAADVPLAFELHQNYPNPFNPSTTISFTIPARAHTTLQLYDMSGRMVEALVTDELAPGQYHAQFNGQHLASGVYFARLRSGNFLRTIRMVLLK